MSKTREIFIKIPRYWFESPSSLSVMRFSKLKDGGITSHSIVKKLNFEVKSQKIDPCVRIVRN